MNLTGGKNEFDVCFCSQQKSSLNSIKRQPHIKVNNHNIFVIFTQFTGWVWVVKLKRIFLSGSFKRLWIWFWYTEHRRNTLYTMSTTQISFKINLNYVLHSYRWQVNVCNIAVYYRIYIYTIILTSRRERFAKIYVFEQWNDCCWLLDWHLCFIWFIHLVFVKKKKIVCARDLTKTKTYSKYKPVKTIKSFKKKQKSNSTKWTCERMVC